MKQRLLFPAKGVDEGGHILELGLRRDALLHVVQVATLHPTLVGGCMENGIFLCGCDLPGGQVQRYAPQLSQLTQEGQLLCRGGIAAQNHHRAVGAA